MHALFGWCAMDNACHYLIIGLIDANTILTVMKYWMYEVSDQGQSLWNSSDQNVVVAS